MVGHPQVATGLAACVGERARGGCLRRRGLVAQCTHNPYFRRTREPSDKWTVCTSYGAMFFQTSKGGGFSRKGKDVFSPPSPRMKIGQARRMFRFKSCSLSPSHSYHMKKAIVTGGVMLVDASHSLSGESFRFSSIMILTSLLMLLPYIVIVLFILVIRIVVVLKQIRRHSHQEDQSTRDSRRRIEPISTVIVLGSGGHTTEMLQLMKGLNPEQYTPLIFLVAQTDTTSLRRVEAMDVRRPDQTYFIPRSREVGQSYSSSIFTTIWSLIYTLSLVMRIRPGLLLCNGPGTCLPIAVWTFVGRILGSWEGKIVFCESFCRVETLSLTGKLLYPIVDLFIVHWEQLQTKFPRSHLVSTFVPRTTRTTATTG